MINENLAQTVLFEPLNEGGNQLYILSGYATPNMASWYFKNLQNHLGPRQIEVSLLLGMVPHDGLSISVHEGFKQLVTDALPQGISSFNCSYVFSPPAVHSKLYIWARDNVAYKAFIGSANFSQTAFSSRRREILAECDCTLALNYYKTIEADSIYCNVGEIEEYVTLQPSHPILDEENRLNQAIEGAGVETVTLSLLSRTGETGERSGINWGQREGRNPNQAYISLPRATATTGFFPLGERHFTVITDDRHQLILRVEQENDKAITTPLSNAQLGEYLRNRLGLANGAYVTRAHLEEYGRTDISFYKLDDEQFYMDFSV